METRVDRTVFERTDFGSFGWLKEGPLTPVYNVSFFNAIDDLPRSFRTKDRVKLNPLFTDFGSFGWLKEGPLTPPWEVAFFASTDTQLRSSFRVRDKARSDPRLTDFGDFAWIFKVLAVPFDVSLFTAIEALTKSFRSKEKTRLDNRLTDFGSFGWIKEGPITPPYETAFFASIDALAKSFRSRDKTRLDSRLTDFGSFGWIAKVPENLPEPTIAIPDYIFVLNPITGKLDRVVNNVAILKADVDETDPTGGGGAATGRIPITINGVTKYIPYY